MDGQYYVYTHTNILNNEIFYVGSIRNPKNKFRAWCMCKRNDEWMKTVEEIGIENVKPEIYKRFNTLKEAYSCEIDLIDELQLIGQAKCNKEGRNQLRNSNRMGNLKNIQVKVTFPSGEEKIFYSVNQCCIELGLTGRRINKIIDSKKPYYPIKKYEKLHKNIIGVSIERL